jgi:hypothetical protein
MATFLRFIAYQDLVVGILFGFDFSEPRYCLVDFLNRLQKLAAMKYLMCN